MSTLYKCDRCKTTQGFHYRVTIDGAIRPNGWDLCGSCSTSLREFMGSLDRHKGGVVSQAKVDEATAQLISEALRSALEDQGEYLLRRFGQLLRSQSRRPPTTIWDRFC